MSLAGDCISATGKLGAVTRQWNAAVKSGDSGELDSAARTMGSTADDLRDLADDTKDGGFASRARGTASELDKMKQARDNRRSVRTGDFNTAARGLRNYCQERLGVAD